MSAMGTQGREERRRYAAGIPAPRNAWKERLACSEDTRYLGSREAAPAALGGALADVLAAGAVTAGEAAMPGMTQLDLFGQPGDAGDAAARLDEQIIEAWVARRELLEYGFSADLGLIRRFLKDTGKHIGELSPVDADRWLSASGVVQSTKRRYQHTLAELVGLALCEDYGFAELMRQFHGSVPRPLINDGNRIRHIDYRHDAIRMPVSDEEMGRLFAAVDRLAAGAHDRGVKGALSVSRDGIVISTMAGWGLRRNEACLLAIADLQANPRCPEFGPYGLLYPTGKGFYGHGPTYLAVRTLPETEAAARRLAWYVNELRPLLLSQPDGVLDANWDEHSPYPLILDHERCAAGAVFPSAMTATAKTPLRLVAAGHGAMDANHLGRRWLPLRKEAELPPERSLHCLRHRFAVKSYIWHEGDIEKVRVLLRHRYLSSTCVYLAGLSKEISREAVRVATSRFDAPAVAA